MTNFVRNPIPIPVKKQTFPVTGMSCAACASSVESILSHTPGVQEAAVNFKLVQGFYYQSNHYIMKTE
jgi:Cu2+-exporting ATPase